jgi:nitrogen fixation protein FixH
MGWPIGVIATLATVVAGNIWVAVKAGSDPSFAIEPDYYAKAVAWDNVMAQARTNASLRWQLTSQLAPLADGQAEIRLVVADSLGMPVRGARVTVSAMHNARASAIHSAQLTADGPDAYVARIPIDRAGMWELRFEVLRGSERYTTSTRVDVARAETP